MTQEELNKILERLIKEGENEFVEFKHNNTDEQMIGERISALSNGSTLHKKNYGYLVFGIQDNPVEIVGTNFSPKTQKRGNESIENWLAQRLNPRIDFRFYEFFTKENLKIVLLQIPASSINQPVSFGHIEYIRVGSITRKLQDFPEKERLLWQKPVSEFEQEIALKNVSEAQIVELLDTQFIFDKLFKIPYPTTQKGVIEKLLVEKIIKRDNGHFDITYLGAFLFAKNLNSFDLEKKAVRIIKYKDKSKIQTEKDYTESMGYANGFEKIMVYIKGLLPSNEIIEFVTREEIAMYPILAVRELLMNAIIHQDFTKKGMRTLVEIFEDRIEISNPGTPILDTQRFIDGFGTRNEMIASAMRRIGFCEEQGSGIDKVINLCEMYQLPAPDFREHLERTYSILYAQKNFSEMEKKDKVRACYQHCCLMYVTNQTMTNQTLRERFKIQEKNYPMVSKIIKNTLNETLIKVEDEENKSKKHTKYIPFWA